MKKIQPEDLDLFRGFSFQDTDCVDSLEGLIGQERAFTALQTAFDIPRREYNVFVVGETGTGRRTFTKRVVQEEAKKAPPSDDWVYVHHFQDRFSPIALNLPSGMGREFRKEMDVLIEDVFKALEGLFESDDYQNSLQKTKEGFEIKRKALWDEMNQKVQSLSYLVKYAQTGIMTIPLKEEKPLTQEQIIGLSDEEKKEYEKNSVKVKHLVEGYLHQLRILEKDHSKEVDQLNRESCEFAIGPSFTELLARYSPYEHVANHIRRVKEDILENLGVITSEGDQRQEVISRYRANLFVDNSGAQGAPVIFEINPTYPNLFGKIEYLSRSGYLYTDFSLIRAGAVHKANGGFMILDARDLLTHPYVWETLKKILYEQKIAPENMETRFGYSVLASIRPQPIPIRLKVILIGEPELYSLLYQLDPDFVKLFRIKAEFDTEFPVSAKNLELFCQYLCAIVSEETLFPLDAGAVREVAAFGMRLVSSRRKISSELTRISDLLVEADQIARKDGQTRITQKTVHKALEAKENRIRLWIEKSDERFFHKEYLVEVEGRIIGQVNGLSVLDTGEFDFGMPVRITANTSIGNSGITDIQREVDLSGKIFKKAVMTLESFFEERFAQDRPLALKATLSFEQTYGPIEGDSATMAETVALFSKLAQIPVRQDIAITGSMGLDGQAQPVGGVSAKIEGFFRVCQLRGLSGTQGVIIPIQNIDSLVLRIEVAEAVRKNEFHIWAVETMDQALELMLEHRVGKKLQRGYQKESINARIDQTLKRYRDRANVDRPSQKAQKRSKPKK